MGLLTLGTPLDWSVAKGYANYVREHGIIQLLNIWDRVSTRRKDSLLWGDEIEYVVLHFDPDSKKVRVSLNAHAALKKLEDQENEAFNKGEIPETSWKPEFGIFMLEATPGSPYGSTLKDLLEVENNMKLRRKFGRDSLGENEALVTVTSFPLLGVDDFCFPYYPPTPTGGSSQSLFISDSLINPHVRFPTLTANIRKRRGGKVAINMPIYKDENTLSAHACNGSEFKEPIPRSLRNLNKKQLIGIIQESTTISEQPSECELNSLDVENLPSLQDLIPDALPDHIYMDCMAFGMGCSCLQITFQACSVNEARRLYDQLTVFAPIMLSLSAAAPIFRGLLADVDCRWNVISASVDDRTKEERGLYTLENSQFRIPKSRYDSVSHYLSPGPNYVSGCSDELIPDSNDPSGKYYKDKYNDIDLVYDKEIYQKLLSNGIDDLLAKHFAHLFIRDPLVIYKETLEQDDITSSEHFENIQSTNWQTIRFKPPPPSSPNMGWRVEFRSMEIQVTDFENAAFSIFVVLLTRTILSFSLNFYIPISKVDANMHIAHRRDSVLEEKFWFRKNVYGQSSRFTRNNVATEAENSDDEDEYEQMTINEIINGKSNFPGLIPLIESYLQSLHLDYNTHCVLLQYLDVIRKKASGEYKTTARWMRDFVIDHPLYKKDSRVSDEIAYDLMKKMEELGHAEGQVVVGK
ncbi:hypothetical protein HK096_002484 [Nowakowskiella sp. JEL0078]|nr:hypothetical protein HK096_002484 [Nowakowskiella sp. JEL0078]